jgi:hypothetical protein
MNRPFNESQERRGIRPEFPGGPQFPGANLRERMPQKLQPFLGIITRQPSPELAAHLQQPEGFGLVVEAVIPDSPAKTAGFEPNDLILRLDDQWIANAPQLEALIRRAGKDKQVMLTILRGGKEQTLSGKIGEKMMPDRRALPAPMPGMMRPGGGGQPQERFPFRPRTGEAGSPEGQYAYRSQEARIVRKDDQGRYELSRRDGKVHFQVIKPDDAVAWAGSVETPAEREAVPSEWRPKLELLERMLSERQPNSAVPPGGDRPEEL